MERKTNKQLITARNILNKSEINLCKHCYNVAVTLLLTIFVTFFRSEYTMALRTALSRLWLNSQRCSLISVSRTQGTSATAAHG